MIKHSYAVAIPGVAGILIMGTKRYGSIAEAEEAAGMLERTGGARCHVVIVYAGADDNE